MLALSLQTLDAGVVAYDFLLTIPDEVRVMWTRPLTGAKILFFLNRYLFVTSNIIQVAFITAAHTNDRVSLDSRFGHMDPHLPYAEVWKARCIVFGHSLRNIVYM